MYVVLSISSCDLFVSRATRVVLVYDHQHLQGRGGEGHQSLLHAPTGQQEASVPSVAADSIGKREGCVMEVMFRPSRSKEPDSILYDRP